MSWLFLDFEASSLGKQSYPVEVGWVFEDGSGDTHLLRPAPGWTDWDAGAAAIHGLTRERLEREGEPVAVVCARLVDLAGLHTLIASAPSWDGHWLSMLLRAAGRPRHLIRLRDTNDAFVEAARQRLGRGASDTAVAALVSRARAAIETKPPAHRALGDAHREWMIWQTIRSEGE
ncbi:MAG TPA: transcriptional regulator [Devosia sp.]|nr:transcriptional regulator [Devosia sp.]